MKNATMKNFAIALSLDVIAGTLFYLWRMAGIDGAGNALQALAWGLTSLTLFASLTYICSEDSKPGPQLNGFLRLYIWLRVTVKTIAFAWVGCFWLTGFYLLGLLFYAAAQVKSGELRAATTAANGCN